MSRMTISSSASADWPAMPSRLDHSPSCMWPPAASVSSSQCCAKITPRSAAYSSARRMSAASCTPRPSSVNSRTPSCCHLGDRRETLPRATDGDRSGDVHVAERRLRTEVEHLVHDRRAVDRGFGVRHRDDARCNRRARPRAIRSRPSRLPHVRADADACGGRRGQARPRIRTRRGSGRRASRRRPPRCDRRRPRRRPRRGPGRVDDTTTLQHEISQDRLLHRATSRGPPSAPRRRSRTCCVITARGRSATSAAISTPRFIGPGCITSACSGSRATRLRSRPNRALYSRSDGTSASVWRSSCIRRRYTTSHLGSTVVEVAAHVDGPALEARGQQRAWRDQGHPRAECIECEHVRSGDTRVLDVADDRDVQTLDRAIELRADRVAVEQRLGGVLVPAIACVHDRRVDPAGDLPRHARRLVAHDDRVDTHRLDRLDRVAQRLALVHRRRAHAERHRVG